jgi:hypothetical protein
MRRAVMWAIATAVLVSVVMAGAAVADHTFFVPDAKDCKEMAAPGGVVTDPGQADRGMACISDGNAANGVEYYLGGEAQAETPHPDDPTAQPGETCGALVVGGQVGSASRVDDPATAEHEGLDWDWNHPHDPDGVPGTGDEFSHHHTCD